MEAEVSLYTYSRSSLVSQSVPGGARNGDR